MKKYKGSFTIEAVFVLPLILTCICVVITMGIGLYQEVQKQAELQAGKETLDMVKGMYQREYVKELFGN